MAVLPWSAAAFEAASHGIRVVATAPGGTEAPPRKVPRHPDGQSALNGVWYQQIVDQTTESTLFKTTVSDLAGHPHFKHWANALF